MKTKEIKTPLGYLNGRDTIHLDNVNHDLDSMKMVFKGQIYGSSVSEFQSSKWINYELEFAGVYSYKCTPLDDFNENLLKSSFDEVETNDGTAVFKEYILSTYDHVYEIKAKNYNFSFNP